MAKRKDENELAKSVIDDIIDWTESEDFNKPVKEKNPAAVALGKLGGKKGGEKYALRAVKYRLPSNLFPSLHHTVPA